MSDLMTTNPVSIQLPTFKSAALAEQANAAARILNGLAASTRLAANDVARILCTIDTGKLYEDDGFKTTAEFAEKCLGLKKSTVSTLIGAGKRFLVDGTSNPLPNQTAYNMYYLKDFSDETIKEAVDSGELSNASTQADIKAWADSHAADKEDAKNAKPEVVPMFKVSVRVGNVITTGPNAVTKDDITTTAAALAHAESGKYETVALPATKTADGQKVNRALLLVDETRDMPAPVLVYWTMVKSPKTAKPKAKTANYTVAELEAMLAAARVADMIASKAESADKSDLVSSILSKGKK